MAQLSGVALGVSAAALLALDVPGLRSNEPAKPQVTPTAPDRAAARIELPVDKESAAAAAVRLEQAVTRPALPQQAALPKTPQTTPDQPGDRAIAYVGPIYEGTRTLAVVSVDGRQSILPEGRSFAGMKLVSVSDDKIVLDTESGSRTVHRSERSGTSVSWVRNMPTNAVAVVGGPNQTAVRRANTPGGRAQTTQGSFSPDVEQRLRQGGIDPREAQRWREVARQRDQQGLAVNAAAARAQDLNRGLLEDRVPTADADMEGVDIEVETVTREDGDVVITRLRRMHESGTLTEDEYNARLKRLEEEGKVRAEGEKNP